MFRWKSLGTALFQSPSEIQIVQFTPVIYPQLIERKSLFILTPFAADKLNDLPTKTLIIKCEGDFPPFLILKCEGDPYFKQCSKTFKIPDPKCINYEDTGHLVSWKGCLPMLPESTPSN
ncbi:hypothetical protein CEXT_120931 [Caerostris extrusa]|uniref:Uncharacterized protein n=1 Tax=Caerostris extrusa TaxID=172846 RepID=A0AAV4TQG5_CAEEX|nr:hypothetical protein CEXT_120931 [Caerostris extrusa]